MGGIAHFSGKSGRGVVYTPIGTYIIEVSKMYEPELAGNTNIRMLMQGANDIEDVEAADFPFRKVYDLLKLKNEETWKAFDEQNKVG